MTFRPNFRQATSVDIEANSKADIVIDIDPPDRARQVPTEYRSGLLQKRHLPILILRL